MISTIATGSVIVLAAGVLQGMYAVPMKFAKRWNYENIWLLFTVNALVVFPWILTAVTVPHLGAIYRATPLGTLVVIAGFGLCWGIGVTLIGLGLNMLGIGLGFAVILGLSASVGSLIPLFVLNPEKICTYQGYVYMIGTAIMLIGVACGARAGFLRDKEQKTKLQEDDAPRSSFFAGLLIVIVAGLLSSSLNFCYAFGGAAIAAAEAQGTSAVWSSNVITALATTGGFIANLIYCGYLLWKNSTTRLFWSDGAGWNWLCGILMAVCWFGGQAMYGLGSSRSGDLGTVVSWPLLMGMIIITSNIAGFLAGEWTATSRRSRVYLCCSMATILVALGILALGHSA